MVEELFRSKLAIKILETLYFRSEELYVREIARLLGSPVSTTSKQLEALLRTGLVTAKTRGGVKFFRPNPESPIGAEMKGLIVKSIGMLGEMRRRLEPIDGIELAYLVGKVDWNWPVSEPLRMVVVGTGLAGLEKAAEEAAGNIGRKIRLARFTPEEYRAIPDEDVAGTHTVLFG